MEKTNVKRVESLQCVACQKDIDPYAPHYNFPNRGIHCMLCGDEVEISDEEIHEAMEKHRLKSEYDFLGKMEGEY